jgi:uncharacterized protein (TIGR03067 family)
MIASLMLFVLSLAPADDQKVEVARHQGTWNVVSFVRDGKPSSKELTDSIVRVVEGDHVVWRREGKSFAGTTFELDLSKDPKTIDLIPDGGKARGEHVLGVYKWDGDTLVICTADAGKPRPTAFEASAGSGQTLMTFRRQTP